MAWELVAWQNYFNAVNGSTPSSLVKVSSDIELYNSFARTTKTITLNDGSGLGIEFSLNGTAGGSSAGLTSTYTTGSLIDIWSTCDFVVRRWGSLSGDIWEFGSKVSNFSVTDGDVVDMILNVSGFIEYYKNSVLVYTSSNVVTYPIFGFGSLRDSGHSIEVFNMYINSNVVTPINSVNYSAAGGRKNFRRQFNPGSDII